LGGRQPHGGQRGAHPLPRLAYGFIGQPYHQKIRQPARDLDLHFHRLRVDPGKGKAVHARNRHKPPV